MTERPPEAKGQGTRAMFASLALGSMLAGLAVYLLQGPLGIPADTARFIAITFVAVGFADAALLVLWDRLFKRDR